MRICVAFFHLPIDKTRMSLYIATQLIRARLSRPLGGKALMKSRILPPIHDSGRKKGVPNSPCSVPHVMMLSSVTGGRLARKVHRECIMTPKPYRLLLETLPAPILGAWLGFLKFEWTWRFAGTLMVVLYIYANLGGQSELWQVDPALKRAYVFILLLLSVALLPYYWLFGLYQHTQIGESQILTLWVALFGWAFIQSVVIALRIFKE